MLGVLLALVQLLIGPVLAATVPDVADVTVQAVQAGTTVTAMTAAGETLVTEHRYIGLDEFTEPVDTEIRFSGVNAEPGSIVVINIPDVNIEQTAVASSAGDWSLAIPTAQLPAGQRSATVSYKVGDTMTDPVTVAEFEVKSAESLSSSTWLFLLSTSIAIVALLLAITMQLRYNFWHNPVV